MGCRRAVERSDVIVAGANSCLRSIDKLWFVEPDAQIADTVVQIKTQGIQNTAIHELWSYLDDLPVVKSSAVAEWLSVNLEHHSLYKTSGFWKFLETNLSCVPLAQSTNRRRRLAGFLSSGSDAARRAQRFRKLWAAARQDDHHLSPRDLRHIWAQAIAELQDEEGEGTAEELIATLQACLLRFAAARIDGRSRAMRAGRSTWSTRERVLSHEFLIGNPPPVGVGVRWDALRRSRCKDTITGAANGTFCKQSYSRSLL
jgi:hypothetical protein